MQMAHLHRATGQGETSSLFSTRNLYADALNSFAKKGQGNYSLDLFLCREAQNVGITEVDGDKG